jgi:hypothetical protein
MSIALTSSSSGAAPYLFFKVQRLNGPNPNYIAKRLHKASCRVQVAPYLFLHITRVICGAGTDQTSTRTSKPSVMGSFLLSLVTSPPPPPTADDPNSAAVTAHSKATDEQWAAHKSTSKLVNAELPPPPSLLLCTGSIVASSTAAGGRLLDLVVQALPLHRSKNYSHSFELDGDKYFKTEGVFFIDAIL